MNDVYKNLEELIEKLEKIRSDGDGQISLPKSIYLLAIELKELKQEIYKLKK